MLVIQKQMQLLQEEGQNVLRRQAKLHSECPESNDSTDTLYVAVQGGIQQCKQHFLSIQEVAKQNVKKWSEAMERVAAQVALDVKKDRVGEEKTPEEKLLNDVVQCIRGIATMVLSTKCHTTFTGSSLFFSSSQLFVFICTSVPVQERIYENRCRCLN